jgi:hypothetical protein
LVCEEAEVGALTKLRLANGARILMEPNSQNYVYNNFCPRAINYRSINMSNMDVRLLMTRISGIQLLKPDHKSNKCFKELSSEACCY